MTKKKQRERIQRVSNKKSHLKKKLKVKKEKVSFLFGINKTRGKAN